MSKRNKLIDILNSWGNYKSIDSDIKNYNRADTVNMSENEMNKFRHIAGPAYLTSTYYTPGVTDSLGKIKEVKDLIMGRGFADTKNDLRHNTIGIELGEKSQGINKKTLFDYIFKTQIEPYR